MSHGTPLPREEALAAVRALKEKLEATVLPPIRCAKCDKVIRIERCPAQSRKLGKEIWAGYHGNSVVWPPCPWTRRFWPSAEGELAAREAAKGEPK